jgi:5-methylcytosine-specific restriction endonuclease McrA
MPISPEIKRRFYGHHWRTVVRPVVITRAGGCCQRCRRPWKPLEVAHLDGDPSNLGEDYSNLAALCRTCHRMNDFVLWAARCRETRARRKDARRPLLAAEVM